jgi:hypothetical protein
VRTSIRCAGIAALMLGLAACVPPPPPPMPPQPAPMPIAPPPPYAAPVPMPAPGAYRCGPGFHRVRGHRNQGGRWVRAHCVPNRW